MVNLKKWTNISVIFIGIYLLVLVLREFSAILRPLAIAFILSFLFIPSFDPKVKKKKMVWIIPVVIIILIILFVISILNPIKQEVADLDLEYDGLLENNLTVLNPKLDVNSTEKSFQDIPVFNYNQLSALYFKIIDSSLKFVSDFVSEIIVLILFLIFLLSAYPRTIIPILRKNKEYLSAFLELEQTIKNYLYAKSVLSFLTACISFFILLIFGVNFKFLLAGGIFLLNFIPAFGSMIAVALALLVHYFGVGFGWNLVGLAILLGLVQLVIGNYLDPKYVGKKLNLSPIIVLLSLLFWGIVWGIPGMLFSVPLTSMVIIIVKHYSDKS